MTHVEPTAQATPRAAVEEPARRVVGMRKWLQLTARKHSSARRSDNEASQAAADALALMLREARKIG